jgi:pimeloyl-ACP methyl ester carboxylesterase
MDASVLEHRIQTRDGRWLQVQEAGDPTGTPVLYHNGSPNSRFIYQGTAEEAAAHGVRILCYDRPGYGASTHQPDRRIADCAADVSTIADALGISRLGVYGASGGGAHALACAALLPDLVPAVAVLAGMAPWGAEDLDYFDGMGEMNAEDIQLYLSDEAAWRKKGVQDRIDMITVEPDQVHAMLETLISPADAAVLTPHLVEYLVASTRDGLAPGEEGWAQDAVAHMVDWGFELDSITTPVLLLHGRQDRFVPFGHGVWLSQHIPGVEARLTDEDGHLTLHENHQGEVFDWLLERM